MNALDNVTVSFVIRESWWKQNGTTFGRLRITFKRDSRFIKTNILLHREDIGKTGKIKNQDIRCKSEDLVRATEKTLAKLDTYSLQNLTIDQIVAFLQRSASSDEDGQFMLDFFSFAEEVIGSKTGQSQKTYRTALNAFKAFVGKDTMDISELTSSLMRSWEAALVSKHGKGARAISAYTACIAFIHGQARLKYNDEEFGNIRIRNPFQFYKPPRQKPSRHRDVDTAIIQKMIDMRKSLTGRERMGVDVFLISFALMGMNSPDIFDCAAPQNGILHYCRTKTRDRRDDNAEMFVKMDPLVMELFEEYKGTDGVHAFKFQSHYSSYLVFGTNVNKGLDKFRKRVKYPDKITLYWARHSWASIAYEVGVEKSLINDGLCHVDRDMKVTDIYINKDWSLLWEANSKVLKSFKWGTEEKISPAAMEKKKRMTSKQIILSRPAFSASRRLQSTA